MNNNANDNMKHNLKNNVNIAVKNNIKNNVDIVKALITVRQ